MAKPSSILQLTRGVFPEPGSKSGDGIAKLFLFNAADRFLQAESTSSHERMAAIAGQLFLILSRVEGVNLQKKMCVSSRYFCHGTGPSDFRV
jgi:hypothetical protein